MDARKRRISYLLTALLVLLLSAAGTLVIFGNWANSHLNAPLPIPAEGVSIEVAAGESFSHVVSDLELRGLLEHGWLVRLWARYFGNTLVQRGEYSVDPGATAIELLDKLNLGDVIQYRVALIEGTSIAQVLQNLRTHPELDVQSEGLSAQEVVDQLGLEIEHPEGWFYPDTYHFSRGDSDLDILRRAHTRMQSILNELWSRYGPSDVIATPYEALILASIIEKETGVTEERGAIAGVFVRRLQRGMRLQTDPTVIYGIEDYDGNITRRHLETWTPYNTYMIDGLPPTPIALPGREALEAVFLPEPGDALFFVAMGDGRHQFSATLEEHNAAVRKYQIEQRSEQYRSAPE